MACVVRPEAVGRHTGRLQPLPGAMRYVPMCILTPVGRSLVLGSLLTTVGCGGAGSGPSRAATTRPASRSVAQSAPRSPGRPLLAPRGPYRFAATPVVLVLHGPALYYRVFARLNRRLPRQPDGGFRGVLTVNGALGDAGIGRAGPRDRCYSYVVDDAAPYPRSLRHPVSGQSVTVTLALSRPHRSRVSAHARLQRAPDSLAALDAILTPLGCPGFPP